MHDNFFLIYKIVLVQMVLLLNKQLHSTYIILGMHYFCGHVRLFPINIGLIGIIENEKVSDIENGPIKLYINVSKSPKFISISTCTNTSTYII